MAYDLYQSKFKGSEIDKLLTDAQDMPIRYPTKAFMMESIENAVSDKTTAEEVEQMIEEHEYELPIATKEKIGGIKVGDGLSIDEDGTLKADAQKITSIGDIDDVDITESLRNKQVLTWDAGSGQWINKDVELSVNELKDVETNVLEDDDVLVYDKTNLKWKNKKLNFLQKSIMPDASTVLNNTVVQYIGATAPEYKKGAFYSATNVVAHSFNIDKTTVDAGQVLWNWYYRNDTASVLTVHLNSGSYGYKILDENKSVVWRSSNDTRTYDGDLKQGWYFTATGPGNGARVDECIEWVELDLGGVESYESLSDKPSINGHELTGNQTAADLGITSDKVIANPEKSATAELKKLQINNDIFSIPEGGGGSTSGDLYFSADDFSLDEKCIGRWKDGKPLYRKGFVTTMPTTSTDGTSVSSTINIGASVDMGYVEVAYRVLTDSIMTIINSSTINNPIRTRIYIRQNTSTSTKNVIAIDNAIKSWSGSTVVIFICYTKTTDATNSFDPYMITSKFSVSGIGYENYSSNEVCVGRWIDGRPLYRKIFIVNADATSKTIAMGVPIKEYTNLYFILNTSTGAYRIGMGSITSGAITSTLLYTNERKSVDTKNDTIVLTLSSATKLDIVTVVEYTKTTDAENSFTPDMVYGGLASVEKEQIIECYLTDGGNNNNYLTSSQIKTRINASSPNVTCRWVGTLPPQMNGNFNVSNIRINGKSVGFVEDTAPATTTNAILHKYTITKTDVPSEDIKTIDFIPSVSSGYENVIFRVKVYK